MGIFTTSARRPSEAVADERPALRWIVGLSSTLTALFGVVLYAWASYMMAGGGDRYALRSFWQWTLFMPLLFLLALGWAAGSIPIPAAARAIVALQLGWFVCLVFRPVKPSYLGLMVLVMIVAIWLPRARNFWIFGLICQALLCIWWMVSTAIVLFHYLRTGSSDSPYVAMVFGIQFLVTCISVALMTTFSSKATS